MTPLDPNFVTGRYTVLCGRGRAYTKSSGNQYLRKLIEARLDAYSQAKTKHDKSIIVTAILQEIRQKSPMGAFVKKMETVGHQWYEVSEAFAREKIGCIFRDLLHTQDRSSTKSKVARKKRALQMALEDTRSVSSSSSSSPVTTPSHTRLDVPVGYGRSTVTPSPIMSTEFPTKSLDT